MLLIPFLHPYPQKTVSAQANHHRRPWSGLRSLALCLAITLGLGWLQPASAALVWQIQTVDNAGIVGFINALALDSSSKPFIAYDDESNGKVRSADAEGEAEVVQQIFLPLVNR